MPALAASNLKQEPKTNGLYDQDFYSWTMRQAEALKQRDFNAIDWDNLIEEINEMGISYRNGWTAYCAQTIHHLLKIEYGDRATDWSLGHWAQEVEDFRKQMAKLIVKNPGLKSVCDEMFAEAWEDGRDEAVKRLAASELQRLRRRTRTASDDTEQAAQPKDRRRYLQKEMRRKWERALPRKCPYSFEHVTAFDAQSDRKPSEDIWPPAVARILNARLGTNYPILPEPARGGWER